MFTIPLVFSLFPIQALAEPANHELNKKNPHRDDEKFQQLLAQVDPSTLHAVLHHHSPKKFQHGMFREDKTAVEVIHRDDAPLATSIINLAKRQEISNGTFTSVAVPSESPSATTPLAESSDAPEPAPEQDSTTVVEPNPSQSEPQTIETASPLSDSESTSPSGAVSIDPSTTEILTDTEPTPSAGASETLSSPSPTPTDDDSLSSSVGSVFTITNSFGVIIVTTVGGEARTIGSITSYVPTFTTEPSSFVGLSTRRQSSRSSVILRTTTLPDGSQSTVTAITIVPNPGDDSPTPTGEAGVIQGTGTGTGTAAPGLQTGVAVRTGSVMKEMLCVIGGTVGMAMLM